MKRSLTIVRQCLRGVLAGSCSVAWLALPAPAAAFESLDGGRPLSTAEEADTATMKRLFFESLNSPDLRVCALVGVNIDPTQGGARTIVPIDTLAELVRGSTDPLLLALMINPCSNDRLQPRPTCSPVDLATRWTIAETQNQVAWLTLASLLHARSDEAGARQAFQRAGQASSWHEYYDEGSRVVAAALPASLGSFGRVRVLQTALTTSGTLLAADGALLAADGALLALWSHCKDLSLRDACLHILDTIDRDSGTLMSAQAGVRIGERVGIDPQVLAGRQRRLDALRGSSASFEWRDLTALTSPADQDVEATRLQRRIQLGEMGWLRKVHADSGLSESAAGERYRRRVAEARQRAADADARVVQ